MGKEVNQETKLQRSCDTRWGLRLATLVNMIKMFSATIDVLEIVSEFHPIV